MDDSNKVDEDCKHETTVSENTCSAPAQLSVTQESEIVANGVSHKSANTTNLQRKLEKRIEQAWKTKGQTFAAVEQQPRRSMLLPLNRIPIPDKAGHKPLVTWESDSESEVEVDFVQNRSRDAADLRKQLLQDSYSLDLSPDEDDLDLIPPRPITKRCICCQPSLKACSIQ